MNGSTNPPLDKEEHVLKLGESFEKRPKSSFHTIRCECERKSSNFALYSINVLLPGPGYITLWSIMYRNWMKDYFLVCLEVNLFTKPHKMDLIFQPPLEDLEGKK